MPPADRNTDVTPTRARSQAVPVLLALVAGIMVGAVVRANGSDALINGVGFFDVIGTLWINAIRMTVIPLVAALTIVAVAQSGDARQVGRLGAYAIGVFVALLLASGALAALLAPLSFERLALAPDVAARLRASLASASSGSVTVMPTLAQRIVDMCRRIQSSPRRMAPCCPWSCLRWHSVLP